MAKLTVRLDGLKELEAKIQEVRDSLAPEKVEPVLLEGAQIIADRIREKAPKGPTGRLKEAATARQLKRLGKGPAPAVAALDRKIAPHAHLVEYGHKTPSGGRVPAKPYFRPAVDETERTAARHVMQKLDELLDKAVR
ncbi:MAG: HK97-gp10 family putative phage morphogenesis protein [Betaproteobacteria bacterium]